MLGTAKIKNYAGLAIKLLIGFISFAFIFYQLAYKKNLPGLIAVFLHELHSPMVMGGIMIVVFLMLFNWFTEALKWRFLINIVSRISILNSFKAVILGINTSIFMPNRIGEFVGRVFLLETKIRPQALILTFVGNFAQFLSTVIFGTSGLIWYLMNIHSKLIYPDYLKWLIILLSLILTVGLILLFFNPDIFLPLMHKLFGKKKFFRYFLILRKLEMLQLLKVLLFSLVRYLIFSFQFWLLLRFFGVNISFLNGMFIVFLIYYILTIVPTIALVEIGVRGAVSVFIISLFVGSLTDAQQLAVIFVAFLLWLINLAIPALIGIFFIKDLRFFSKNQ